MFSDLKKLLCHSAVSTYFHRLHVITYIFTERKVISIYNFVLLWGLSELGNYPSDWSTNTPLSVRYVIFSIPITILLKPITLEYAILISWFTLNIRTFMVKLFSPYLLPTSKPSNANGTVFFTWQEYQCFHLQW